MPREITIELDDDATMDDLEKALIGNDQAVVKDWVEEHNQRLVATMTQSLDQCIGRLERVFANLQQQIAHNQQEYMQTQTPMDISPLVKQNEKIMQEAVKAVKAVGSSVKNISVDAPPMPPKAKRLKINRKFDRFSNFEVADSIDVEYED